MDKRHRNWFQHREARWEEVPWLRPNQLRGLDLPRPIVLINGSFDLLHRTHMRLIFAARAKAATLICALDTDEKVAKEKGENRPILNFTERATTLNYMPLDYIIPVADKRDMNTLMASLRPDLRVQGMDHADRASRYSTQKMLVREGSVHTTEIIDRILERYAQK